MPMIQAALALAALAEAVALTAGSCKRPDGGSVAS